MTFPIFLIQMSEMSRSNKNASFRVFAICTAPKQAYFDALFKIKMEKLVLFISKARKSFCVWYGTIRTFFHKKAHIRLSEFILGLSFLL
jgi:hypothetical protein